MNRIDKIKDRVSKLLRLADNNPSVEEAAAAFAQAQRLATAYGLGLDEIDTDPDEPARKPPTLDDVVVRRVHHAGRWSRWRWCVLHALAKANLADCYHQGGDLYVYGTTEATQLVDLAFQAITHQIDAMARREVRGRGRAWGNAFRLGAANTVARRFSDMVTHVLEHERQLAGGEVTALARVETAIAFRDETEAVLEDKAIELGIRTRNRPGAVVDPDGYASGREAGRGVALGGGKAALS